MAIVRQYQNTRLTAGKSDFVDAVNNPPEVNSAAFSSGLAVVKTQAGEVRMVNGGLTLVLPFTMSCDEQCPSVGATLNETMKVTWNVRYGEEANFTSLLTEITRLLTEAVEEYNLLKGIVPPSSATFVESDD